MFILICRKVPNRNKNEELDLDKGRHPAVLGINEIQVVL
jgi:hypothetical protein